MDILVLIYTNTAVYEHKQISLIMVYIWVYNDDISSESFYRSHNRISYYH